MHHVNPTTPFPKVISTTHDMTEKKLFAFNDVKDYEIISSSLDKKALKLSGNLNDTTYLCDFISYAYFFPSQISYLF